MAADPLGRRPRSGRHGLHRRRSLDGPHELVGGRVRLGAQLAAQHGAQRVVLLQRGRLLAGLREQADQGAVGRLVRRLRGRHAAEGVEGGGELAGPLLERAQLDQRVQPEPAQGLAPAGRPLLVGIVGEQVALVERQRLLVACLVPGAAPAAAAASKASASIQDGVLGPRTRTSSVRLR